MLALAQKISVSEGDRGVSGAREALTGGIATLLSGLAIVVAAVWLPQPSLALFLAGGIVAGAGARGCCSRARSRRSPSWPRSSAAPKALAGIFLAGYIGISLPVISLGVLLQLHRPAGRPYELRGGAGRW